MLGLKADQMIGKKEQLYSTVPLRSGLEKKNNQHEV